jgi:hypothetical protein
VREFDDGRGRRRERHHVAVAQRPVTAASLHPNPWREPPRPRR